MFVREFHCEFFQRLLNFFRTLVLQSVRRKSFLLDFIRTRAYR